MAEKKQLFPVVELPVVRAGEERPKKYRPSLRFDFSAGDFVRDGTNRLVFCEGREGYEQWCRKCVQTERGARLAYSSAYGVELEAAKRQPGRAAVQSAIERTVTEALSVHPATEYVRGFVFTWRADELECSFTIKGRPWEEIRISAVYRAA